MMNQKDFENFDKFIEEQKKVLIEKAESTYKEESYKNSDEDDLLEEMYQQIENFEYSSDDPKYKKRRLLHIANYAFFLYDNLKE